MPIKIDFLANVRDFVRGTGDAEKALDDVADSLDDMAAGAKKGGRDAERSVEQLEDGFRDAARRARDLGDAGKEAGKDVERGMDRASEGVDDFKSEAQQSAREAAASFDGSMESIADLGQEIAANAFSGFGPAGVAAGVGVAAAAGVMIEQFNKINEAAEEARESAFAMAYDVAGALDAAGYAARLQEWTGSTEKLNQVRDIAIGTGWDEVEVVDALAAGGDKIKKLNDAWGDGAEAQTLTSGRIWEIEAALKATSEGYLDGAQAADINARALYNFAQQAGTATGEVDDLGNRIYELPDSTQVVVDAKTQKAYENVDQLESKVGGIKDKNVNVSVSANTDQAQREINAFITRNASRALKIAAEVFPKGGWDR
ncbi:hypothetical protein FVO59_12780 [Microbacterium esteraromaticum]|uniref:Uncharacterized protein n=1 Tax=Microbacterium esteraromaticum TaxID=57043 RepID=A0A7D7WCB6_9MICO|nr:hypothetical protein [Microbacterium esteraromaticum]QMU97978.1 hypothetical protein FVO59_12780 [Microbacterium esteraromaticum]